MKKKFLFLIAGIAILGLASTVLKAEQPECSTCFISPPWGLGADYMQFSGGDCYGPTYEFCGTVVHCMTGLNYCDPWQCNTSPGGCTVTFPN